MDFEYFVFILDRVNVSFARSGGPGGQNVNKGQFNGICIFYILLELINCCWQF